MNQSTPGEPDGSSEDASGNKGDDTNNDSSKKDENSGDKTSKGDDNDNQDTDKDKNTDDDNNDENSGDKITKDTGSGGDSTGDEYDIEKNCKKVAACKPKTFKYMGVPYDNTCAKGENEKRPWCSTHTDSKGQHDGDKVCCDCKDWKGKMDKCDAAEGDCPSKWVKKELGCYLFGSDKKTYSDSRKFCTENNGRLISIESEKEAKYIAEYINAHGKAKDFWFGATDLYKEGNWVWDYNKKPITGFTNWQKSEPNNIHHSAKEPDEDCGHLGRWPTPIANYLWNDEPCTRQKFPLCEFSKT